MMKITMFRVEDQYGNGPYALADGTFRSGEGTGLKMMYVSHGDESHPTPYEDDKLCGIADDEICGFATLAALEEWFSGWEDTLEDAGYHISAYTVPYTSCRFGTEQDVFLRKDAELSRVMTMQEI